MPIASEQELCEGVEQKEVLVVVPEVAEEGGPVVAPPQGTLILGSKLVETAAST